MLYKINFYKCLCEENISRKCCFPLPQSFPSSLPEWSLHSINMCPDYYWYGPHRPKQPAVTQRCAMRFGVVSCFSGRHGRSASFLALIPDINQNRKHFVRLREEFCVTLLKDHSDYCKNNASQMNDGILLHRFPLLEKCNRIWCRCLNK